MVKGEFAYMSMLQQAVKSKSYPDRTGIGCRKVFDKRIEWGKSFPFSTQRRLGIKFAWEEMRLFLSGNHDTKVLEEKGIMFWAGNTSRKFLNKRGLNYLPEGHLGTSYSHQFRRAGSSDIFNRFSSEQALGVDQLDNLLQGLKSDPFGRRHAIDLWCVPQQNEMPLLPCWYRSAWYVSEEDGRKYLNLKLYNRSLDILFGYFQAAMQYKLLQIVLAHMTGMEVGDMTTDHVDCHVYENQVEYVNELIFREMGTGGEVFLKNSGKDKLTDADSISTLEPDDFEIVGYKPNDLPIKTERPPMAV